MSTPVLSFYNNTLVFGSFLPLSSSLLENIKHAIQRGMYILVLESKLSRTVYRQRLDDDDVLACEKLIQRFPMDVYMYIDGVQFNLCGSRQFLACNGNIHQDMKTSIMMKELLQEIHSLDTIKGGIIIKGGWYRHKERGIRAATQSLKSLLHAAPSRVYIENSFTKDNICQTMKDVHALVHSFDNVGLALNLTSFFIHGVFSFETSENITFFIDTYNTYFSSRSTLIILGDTHTLFGSDTYQPALLGTGVMWTLDSLKMLLAWCKKEGFPVIVSFIEDYDKLHYLYFSF